MVSKKLSDDFKVLIYVQSLLGIGHEMRIGAIAKKMIEQGIKVTYISGGFFAPPLPQSKEGSLFEFVSIPKLRSSGLDFKRLLDDQNQPIDESYIEGRRDLILATFDRINPDAVLIEGFPFARFRLKDEIIPLLEHANQKFIPCYCSLRDILVHLRDERRLETVGRVKKYFTKILVHGSEDFYSLNHSFKEADDISDKLSYTGYIGHHCTYGDQGIYDDQPFISPSTQTTLQDGEDEVIVSAGGGAMGEKLIRAALAAFRRGACPDKKWRFLLGNHLPLSVKRIFDQLSLMNEGTGLPRMIVEKNRPDFRHILSRAYLSISQAGYNTVMDVTISGVRALYVPFSGIDSSEDEQPARARLWQKHGWAEMVTEDELSPESMIEGIEFAQKLPSNQIRLDDMRKKISLDGAQRVIDLIIDKK